MSNNKDNKDNKDTTKRDVILVITVALAAIILVLLLLLLRSCSCIGDKTVSGGKRDANASIGQFEGKTVEQIQAELNRIVEEGNFHISVNPKIVMASGSDKAELRIENVQANRYLMKVQIHLIDTNEVIYTSGIIDPNYHIQSAHLDKTLAAGTYKALVIFQALDPDTEKLVGEVNAEIEIVVET